MGKSRELDRRHPLRFALEEVRLRLAYLDQVGLGYLTLDRPTRTLSGGETERVSLTTCLGTRLVNTLYVLDEPSVGLHPRDTVRLVRILEQLRDLGNTVVVVEHEAGVIRAADQIVDLGPGHGELGGHLVFQGSYREVLRCSRSLTGQYLAGIRRIEIPQRRALRSKEVNQAPCVSGDCLVIRHATRHNLRDLTVEVPLGRLVGLTGVSGSGKTTLVRDVLLPLLEEKLRCAETAVQTNEEEDGPEASTDSLQARLEGWESLGRVVLVDQSPVGRTPRSNPAVYIGAFDGIRALYASSEAARQRGLNASAFSFNSAQGQCERCRGAGFEKVEMQFLSDIFIRCPDCNGRRYRRHILEVRLPGPGDRSWTIGDLLEATVDEGGEFLESHPASRQARQAREGLSLLQEVGLGYLRLGQPLNTLSGGESQRLKLVSHLADIQGISKAGPGTAEEPAARRSIMFLLDEPTTGLHFDDVRILLAALQRLVDAGHSVVVIEHNLEVIKSVDWVIDLGPEAGDQGGRLVVEGTPEQVAMSDASHTGRFLREILRVPAKR
jgi:excinuclease ABC subunit A